nr:PREDICTED: uncharacterized protein LOC102269059 [Bos mutus]
MERETWKSQTLTTSVEQQTSNTKAGKKRMPSAYRPGGSVKKAKRIMQVKRCRQENVSRSRFLKGLIPSIKSKKAREPALTTCHLNETRTENQTEPKKNQETVKKPTISGDDQGRQNLGMVAETTEIPAEFLKSSS